MARRARYGDKLKVVDGMSESLWKSVAIKSLRMGWPAGMRAAYERLNAKTFNDMVMGSVYEDVFPTLDVHAEVVNLVANEEWEQLCHIDTHHGRGYTPRFCDMKNDALQAASTMRSELKAHADRNGWYVPSRVMNCFWTWLMIDPLRHSLRTIDTTPFTGVPFEMADKHTYEWRRSRKWISLLSGSYSQHRVIGERVMREGWEPLRMQVHASGTLPLTDENGWRDVHRCAECGYTEHAHSKKCSLFA